MKKLRIYLDTSVISFLSADDAPEKRDETHEFFERFVRAGTCEIYVSSVVVDEIKRTHDPSTRQRLLDVIHEYRLAQLDNEPRQEMIELAQQHIAQGAIPPGEFDDALHVATSTVHEMDVLVSWNFHHLANIRKEARIGAVNTLLGYHHPLRITTPHQLLSHE